MAGIRPSNLWPILNLSILIKWIFRKTNSGKKGTPPPPHNQSHQTPSYAVANAVIRRLTPPKLSYAADGAGGVWRLWLWGRTTPTTRAIKRRQMPSQTLSYAVHAVKYCQRRHTPPTPSYAIANTVKRCRKRRHTPSQTPPYTAGGVWRLWFWGDLKKEVGWKWLNIRQLTKIATD